MLHAMIIFFMIVLMDGCSPENASPSNNKATVIQYDQEKYDKCYIRSQKEGIPMSRILEECREFSQIWTERDRSNAINVCTKRKEEEIGWTKWEIERYCHRFWRGYK